MKGLLKAVAGILFAAIVGLASRFHGGGFKGGVNKTLKNTLWALLLTIPTSLAFYLTVGVGTPFYVATAGAFLFGFLKAMGHGRGMSVGLPMKVGSSPEKIEYLILWLQDKIPNYWYKALILVLVGLAPALGAAAAFGYLDLLAGLVVALGGMAKALAYMIGWKILPVETTKGPKDFNEATAVGEGLTGVFQGLALATAFHIVV